MRFGSVVVVGIEAALSIHGTILDFVCCETEAVSVAADLPKSVNAKIATTSTTNTHTTRKLLDLGRMV